MSARLAWLLLLAPVLAVALLRLAPEPAPTVTDLIVPTASEAPQRMESASPPAPAGQRTRAPALPTTVTVVDAEGVAVPGALVTWLDPAGVDATAMARAHAARASAEELCRSLGATAATDALGSVALPHATAGTVLWARAGDRCARHVLAAAELGGSVPVQLRPDRVGRVRVEDRHGRPVGGVPVVVHARRRGMVHELAAAQSSPDGGLAVLRGLEACAGPWDAPPVVTIGVPLAEPPALSLAAVSDPVAPPVLRLPATGGVQVEVEGQDHACGPLLVGLRACAEGDPTERAGAAPFWFALLEPGQARAEFPQVGLGLWLCVRILVPGTQDPCDVALRGPIRSDEIVTARRARPQRAPAVRLRAVAHDGRPVVAARAEGHGPGAAARPALARSDATGRITLGLPGGAPARWRLVCLPEAGPPLVATLDLPALAPDQELELGDVLVVPLVPTVAGTCRDDAGQPLDGVQLCCHAGDQVMAWARSDAAGRFAVFAPGTPGERWTLAATREGHLAPPPQDVVVGDQALALVLPAGVSVQGHAGPPDLVAPPQLCWRLCPAPDGAALPGLSSLAWRIAHCAPDGSFRFTGLAPGVYALAATLGRDPEPLLWLRDLVVPAPGGQPDQRLDALDLEPLVSRFRVVVHDADGEPATEATGHLLDARGNALPPLAARGATLATLATRARGRMVVAAPGHQPVLVAAQREEQRITLPRGVEVEVRLAPDVHAPALLAWQPLAEEPLADLRRFVPIPDLALRPGADATVLLPGLGSYRLRLADQELEVHIARPGERLILRPGDQGLTRVDAGAPGGVR